jgi:hypothetical protein
MNHNNKIESEIHFVSPFEMEEAQYRHASIRFDCLVKMFDFGQIESQSGIFLQKSIPRQPQWFKSELRLDLETVAYADPYVLGKAIKDAYNKLKHHIEQYESYKK